MAPRVLIFGTGAIGAFYTYTFSRQLPPSNIVCVCRSNYEAVKSNGLTINSNLWGDNLNVRPVAVRIVQEASELFQESFDFVVVTTKVLNTTPPLAEQIKPVVSPNTTIILIQNGIGIEKPYSTLYPSNPLLSTVVYLPVTQTTPGIITHREVELLHIGTYPASAPEPHKQAARAFTDLVKSCSATAHLHDDIQVERWSKLLVNASWNPVCALTRARDAQFLKASPIAEEETVAYIRDVMAEIASIAQAHGYTTINDELIDWQISRARVRNVPGIEPSMLADARNGRRLEVDAIVGNTVKMAREKGVQTPLLRGLYLLLSALDGSFAREAETSKK